jgi:hypothetical protein
VDAQAEGRVAVLLAVEHDLVGTFERLGIAVRRGNGNSTQSPSGQGGPELDVLGDLAGHGHRRVGPQELLDRDRDQISGSSTRRRRWSGCWARCHNVAPIADHVVSIPAMSRSAIVPTMWSLVERLAVDLGVEQEVDQVVAGSARCCSICSSRYHVSVSSGSTGSFCPPVSMIRWMNTRNLSPSDSGTPSMWAMTRTGMCWA